MKIRLEDVRVYKRERLRGDHLSGSPVSVVLVAYLVITIVLYFLLLFISSSNKTYYMPIGLCSS